MGVWVNLAVCGLAGSGKDTFAECLKSIGGVYRFAHADAVKKIATDYFGMKEKDRKLLQDIGNGMRAIRPSIWIDILENRIYEECGELDEPPTLHDLLTDTHGYEGAIVITDMRFPNEYDHWVRRHKFFPIKIVCPEQVRLERLKKRDGSAQIETLSDVSESYVESMPCFTLDSRASIDEWKKNMARFIVRVIDMGYDCPMKAGHDITTVMF